MAACCSTAWTPIVFRRRVVPDRRRGNDGPRWTAIDPDATTNESDRCYVAWLLFLMRGQDVATSARAKLATTSISERYGRCDVSTTPISAHYLLTYFLTTNDHGSVTNDFRDDEGKTLSVSSFFPALSKMWSRSFNIIIFLIPAVFRRHLDPP